MVKQGNREKERGTHLLTIRHPIFFASSVGLVPCAASQGSRWLHRSLHLSSRAVLALLLHLHLLLVLRLLLLLLLLLLL